MVMLWYGVNKARADTVLVNFLTVNTVELRVIITKLCNCELTR